MNKEILNHVITVPFGLGVMLTLHYCLGGPTYLGIPVSCISFLVGYTLGMIFKCMG